MCGSAGRRPIKKAPVRSGHCRSPPNHASCHRAPARLPRPDHRAGLSECSWMAFVVRATSRCGTVTVGGSRQVARPQRWELLLRASQQEALLAVSLFNDAGRERALEGFVIHMHIAWLYAFQAKWMRDGENYHVLRSERPRRYKQINGERMSQPLEWFLKQEYPSEQSACGRILSSSLRCATRSSTGTRARMTR